MPLFQEKLTVEKIFSIPESPVVFSKPRRYSLFIKSADSFKISHRGSASIIVGGNYKKFYLTDNNGEVINSPV